MNFLGNKPIKITFTFNSEEHIIELDSKDIEAEYTLNQQQYRLHISVLNGAITKEFLGYYHKIKVHFHNISVDEYTNNLRLLLEVDTIKVYPFRDNLDFSIDCIIPQKKAYPYEFEDIKGFPSSFYLEAESNSYSEIQPPLPYLGCLAMAEIQIPLEAINEGCLAMEEIII